MESKKMPPGSREVMTEAKKYLPHGYSKNLKKEIGISLVTISHVLNGKVFNEEVFQRIVKDAQRYKTMIDSARQHLVSNHSISPVKQPA